MWSKHLPIYVEEFIFSKLQVIGLQKLVERKFLQERFDERNIILD